LSSQEITVRQIAVLPEQIDEWDLPTRPTKTHSKAGRILGHAAKWDPDVDSVELDAIPPAQFNALISEALEEYMPQERMAKVRDTEIEERVRLQAWGERMARRIDDAVQFVLDDEAD
jgi:hypothetical protein